MDTLGGEKNLFFKSNNIFAKVILSAIFLSGKLGHLNFLGAHFQICQGKYLKLLEDFACAESYCIIRAILTLMQCVLWLFLDSVMGPHLTVYV